ncbi:STAS domain-containing protein [Rhizobium sp. CSW-27]|uniref:STAS domain-containing protein n=1 Tax=Rhizobium sp. CSW-27 TaxID=2839985 RepID=UPI001C016F73|nr:STAS domain-containing protein [Rhizobium sp. CSW-27]MBT9371970.1 STAS domain-containing protein [Rhizobium sp. CSW-27]
MASGKAETGSLKLVSVLDLNEASVLHGQLSSMRGNDLSIDASGVDRVGVQCVQVLMAAANAWEEDKKQFVFEKVSDAFRKTMQLIGINIDHLLAKEIQQ